jgi:Trk K+ transport system NAD-binding subunit
MDALAPRCSTALNHVLVCGLGSLGQHCIELLKEFGVQIWAIDQRLIEEWEIPDLRSLLTEVVVGDCRQQNILKQAQIQDCRSVLIVTGDERINLETAFAARLLNPTIRIIIRSAKQNLNTLLEKQLGNFIAFEPTKLSAPAFALAALGQESRFHPHDTSTPKPELLGFLKVDHSYYQVIRRHIQPHDRGCNLLQLRELNTRFCRVIDHTPATMERSDFTGFYHWNPEVRLQAGDWLISIEQSNENRYLEADTRVNVPGRRLTSWWQIFSNLDKKRCKAFFRHLWGKPERSRLQRVVIFCGIAVFTLLFLGTLLLYWNFPNMHLEDAFYTTAILLLGGYGDLFGQSYGDLFEQVHSRVTLPSWLRFLSLGLAMAGTAFIGVLYALLTEKLVSWRLQFLPQRLSLPRQSHIIVIGSGRIGQGVLALLQEFKQSLVALSEQPLETHLSPQVPLVLGSVTETLNQVNLLGAKSVVCVTEDDLGNLEFALMAHRANPECRLVLRANDRRFTEQTSQLFPFANVLSISALSSEAFVAAAFGEKVFNLFRIDQKTILTTEYQIEEGDTLNGFILAEIAYGYGIMPILHQRSSQESSTLMPSDDIRLHASDRLVVLATTHGLRRVERGNMLPRFWQVWVEKAMTSEAVFVGANEICRISGCELSTARALMNHLPGILPVHLYGHQAMRLVRRLSRVQVIARAIALEERSANPL